MQIEDVTILPQYRDKHKYRIRVNHPYIKPIYEIYKKKIMPPIWWGYAATDYERFQFECIIYNMFRIGGADEDKRREYFDGVIKGLKKLDLERIRENKKADCITRARCLPVSLNVKPQRFNKELYIV